MVGRDRALAVEPGLALAVSQQRLLEVSLQQGHLAASTPQAVVAGGPVPQPRCTCQPRRLSGPSRSAIAVAENLAAPRQSLRKGTAQELAVGLQLLAPGASSEEEASALG